MADDGEQPADVADGQITLSISDKARSSQRVNGVPFIAAAESDVIITGVSIYGDPGRVKVYASRSAKWLAQSRWNRGREAWDWRNYVMVAEHSNVALSMDEPTYLPFFTPVPISAGGTRRFYICARRTYFFRKPLRARSAHPSANLAACLRRLVCGNG